MKRQHIEKLWERASVAEQRRDWASAKKLYSELLDSLPGHAPTFQRLGLIALRQEQPRDAVDYFQRSLAAEPADPLCLNNLGNVLRELGRLKEAVVAYKRALGFQPEHRSALYNLAGALALLGEHPQAVAAYRDLLRLEPDDAEAWNALGLSLLQVGEEAEAKKALEQALNLKPNDAEILNELGAAHQFEGDLKAAARLYRASMDADPGFSRAYDNYVRSRRMKADDLVLADPVMKIAEDESRDDESRLIARFALGKIYDDCGDADRAFENYFIGNALKRRLVHFDASAHSAWVDRVIEAYDKVFFATHADQGAPSERPVFVVGMIRSGTSLVEQILASHSQVHGAGELLEITKLVTNLTATLNSPAEYPQCTRQLNRNAIEIAAAAYLDFLAERDQRAARVVDKMPTNFLHLGFIAALLPKARVIHCRRHPLDVCLSIYFQRFAQGHFYAYTFDEIAAYYAEYERLMRHWKETLPLKIHEVRYEVLLEDFESQSREMLNYCGLDWEDACLAFHRSERPVRTASSWQVRQPLYKSAMARWRNFDRHLGSLKKALSDNGVLWESA